MYLDKSTFTDKRAVAYLRKSTDDAYRQKYSIQSQREQMQLWAEHFGVIVEQYYVDDHSAKDFHRPGWEQLMQYLKKYHHAIDLVLVIDYSRFSRNDVAAYVYINQLDKWSIELQAIDQLLNYEVPESLIMRGNYITMPAVDNKWRSIKVKRGMIQSLRAGNWCAGPMPRGYWKDKNTGEIHLTEEGKLIGKVFEKIANHDYNIREAQVFLNLRGINVAFKALSKMLRNPFYKGYIAHSLLGDEVVKGKQPAAVSATTWDAVQDLLTGNKKGGRREDLFPLKGFLSCPECSSMYTGYQVKRKQRKDGSYRDRKTFPIYYKCQCSNVPGHLLHAGFVDLLSGICLHHDDLHDFRTELTSVFTTMQSDTMSTAIRLKKQIADFNDFMEKTEEKFIREQLDRQTYEKHMKRSKHQLAEYEKELKKHVQLSNPSKFIDHCIKLLTKSAKMWQESDITNQRRLQRLIFPEGLMYHKPEGLYRTPRINSIFTVMHSFSGDINEKTSLPKGGKLAHSLVVVPTSGKSNPIYIEDFINISNEILLS